MASIASEFAETAGFVTYTYVIQEGRPYVLLRIAVRAYPGYMLHHISFSSCSDQMSVLDRTIVIKSIYVSSVTKGVSKYTKPV